jgi:hypothetical protein
MRSPEVGSAIRGQPVTSCSARTSWGPAPDGKPPATITPRSTEVASSAIARASSSSWPGGVGGVGRNGTSGSRATAAPVGASGSRKGRFTCTGPFGTLSAARAARAPSPRHVAAASGPASGTGASTDHRG